MIQSPGMSVHDRQNSGTTRAVQQRGGTILESSSRVGLGWPDGREDARGCFLWGLSVAAGGAGPNFTAHTILTWC